MLRGRGGASNKHGVPWNARRSYALPSIVWSGKPTDFRSRINQTNKDRRTVVLGVTPGGRLVARNFTLKRLIMFAYRVQEHQVEGGPSWAANEHFNVEAKPSEGANPADEQSRRMLQHRLEERFQ